MRKELLVRDSFREGVFARDNYQCVICGSKNNIDAHHIIERRLFPDGGYYLDNGATLCDVHHMEAEMTTLSVEEVRQAAKIQTPVIPPHFYSDELCDKWGNVFLSNGMRMRGELFDDSSVQKILERGGVLSSFTKYVKYPRTYHLPFSPGATSDDRILASTDQFIGKEVIVSTKQDGENCSIYNDHVHARSLDKGSHGSQSWIKNFQAQIGYDIPDGWRVCGENMFAAHSIQYNNLDTYFYGFSIWNDRNICLDWDTTLEWFALLNIQPVPVIYRGVYDEEKIKNIYTPIYDGCECEGFVVRISDSFQYSRFKNSVAKWVRAGHVTTHDHWRTNWRPNKLRSP